MNSTEFLRDFLRNRSEQPSSKHVYIMSYQRLYDITIVTKHFNIENEAKGNAKNGSTTAKQVVNIKASLSYLLVEERFRPSYSLTK